MCFSQIIEYGHAPCLNMLTNNITNKSKKQFTTNSSCEIQNNCVIAFTMQQKWNKINVKAFKHKKIMYCILQNHVTMTQQRNIAHYIIVCKTLHSQNWKATSSLHHNFIMYVLQTIQHNTWIAIAFVIVLSSWICNGISIHYMPKNMCKY